MIVNRIILMLQMFTTKYRICGEFSEFTYTLLMLRR